MEIVILRRRPRTVPDHAIEDRSPPEIQPVRRYRDKIPITPSSATAVSQLVSTGPRTYSWFSLKENHSSRSLSGHSNCETALYFGEEDSSRSHASPSFCLCRRSVFRVLSGTPANAGAAFDAQSPRATHPFPQRPRLCSRHPTKRRRPAPSQPGWQFHPGPNPYTCV